MYQNMKYLFLLLLFLISSAKAYAAAPIPNIYLDLNRASLQWVSKYTYPNAFIDGNSFTWNVWIYPRSLPANNEAYSIFNMGDGWSSIQFWIRNINNTLGWYFQAGGPNNGAVAFDLPDNVPVNTWSYISIVYDTNNHTLSIYRDAQFVGSNSNYETSIVVPDTTFLIGNNHDSQSFDGYISSVSMLHNAYSIVALGNFYNSGVSLSNPDLYAYYSFDNTYDDAIGGNTMIPQNGAGFGAPPIPTATPIPPTPTITSTPTPSPTGLPPPTPTPKPLVSAGLCQVWYVGSNKWRVQNVYPLAVDELRVNGQFCNNGGCGIGALNAVGVQFENWNIDFPNGKSWWWTYGAGLRMDIGESVDFETRCVLDVQCVYADGTVSEATTPIDQSMRGPLCLYSQDSPVSCPDLTFNVPVINWYFSFPDWFCKFKIWLLDVLKTLFIPTEGDLTFAFNTWYDIAKTKMPFALILPVMLPDFTVTYAEAGIAPDLSFVSEAKIGGVTVNSIPIDILGIDVTGNFYNQIIYFRNLFKLVISIAFIGYIIGLIQRFRS